MRNGTCLGDPSTQNGWGDPTAKFAAQHSKFLFTAQV